MSLAQRYVARHIVAVVETGLYSYKQTPTWKLRNSRTTNAPFKDRTYKKIKTFKNDYWMFQMVLSSEQKKVNAVLILLLENIQVKTETATFTLNCCSHDRHELNE